MSQVHCDVTPVWFSLGLKAYFYGQCKAGAEYIWVRIVNLTVITGKDKPSSPKPGYPYQLWLAWGPTRGGAITSPLPETFSLLSEERSQKFSYFLHYFFPLNAFFFCMCV